MAKLPEPLQQRSMRACSLPRAITRLICFELGNGGAPEAKQKRISDLYTDYCATRDDLGNMEFNAELLDLEPNHVENHVLPANEEEAIQALMKNGGVNKAGSLFRVGISVVNCRVVLETLRRTKEQQEKEKEEKERARKVAEDGKLNSGLEAFGKWCGDGSKVDDQNHPMKATEEGSELNPTAH